MPGKLPNPQTGSSKFSDKFHGAFYLETGKSYLALTPQNRIPNTKNQQQTAA
jgi:hypothetical protein